MELSMFFSIVLVCASIGVVTATVVGVIKALEQIGKYL